MHRRQTFACRVTVTAHGTAESVSSDLVRLFFGRCVVLHDKLFELIIFTFEVSKGGKIHLLSLLNLVIVLHEVYDDLLRQLLRYFFFESAIFVTSGGYTNRA